MAKHLVTGGSGFVGSHTAEYLLERDEEVRIFDRIPPDIPETNLAEKVEYIRGDVRNPHQVRNAVDGVDYVHHNAALVPLTKAGSEFWEVNVGGTEHVARAALEAGIEGVSHISSSAVYDLSRMPVTEETKLNPIGRYGQSKLEGDRIMFEFVKKGLPVNILRPRTVLDIRRAGIYQILFDWVKKDKRIYMLGDGENYFQLISGRDLASASYMAVRSDLDGEVFNIGNEEFNTLGEDLAHLIEHADSSSSITWLPPRPVRLVLKTLDQLRLSPLAPWHYKTVYQPYYFDITKAKSLLDWTPTDSNNEMFERAYDWFESHRIESSSKSGSAHRTAPKQQLLRILSWIS